MRLQRMRAVGDVDADGELVGTVELVGEPEWVDGLVSINYGDDSAPDPTPRDTWPAGTAIRIDFCQ
jgi:hypothetical protein